MQGLTWEDFKKWSKGKTLENIERDSDDDEVRDLEKERRFLQSMNPGSYEDDLVQRLLQQFDTFDQVLDILEEFFKDMENQVVCIEEQEELEEVKEPLFDPRQGHQIEEEEEMNDLTDELILYYYSIYMDAAIEHYGLQELRARNDIHPDTLG